jgi:hypothetical protein
MLTSATISSQNYERNKIRIAILHKTGERSMVISKGKKAVVLPFDGNRSKNLSYLRSLNYPELLVIGSKSDTFYNYKNQNITYLFPGNEDFIFQNENIKLFIFQNNGKRFLKLSIGNTNLVAFPDGGNVKFLPDILKSPEISILFYIPQNFDLIKSKYSILANNSYFSKINSEKLKRLNVIDGTNCDIIIDVDVKSNKNIIGRRI